MNINLVLIVLVALLAFAKACKDPNCINCAIDPAVCKTCKPGFRATQGICVACDDPNCATCNES